MAQEADARDVAWVIGGTSGIGYAVAAQLAQRYQRLIITGRDERRGHQAAESLGEHGQHLFVQVDVRDQEGFPRQLASMLARWGAPDVIFYSAGRDCLGHVDELSPAEWHDTIATNLNGAFLLLHTALPPMRKRRHGAIVLNASTKGLIAHPEDPVYCATKAALIMLAKSVALDVAADGIRVNAVCPGPVDTRLLQHAEYAAHRVPLGRVATVTEVADVVTFLLSDQAAFVTGVAFPVDGGKSAGLLPLRAAPSG